jgi:hypothetical protein
MKKGVGRRVLFKELAELVENDYRINKYRSLVDIELRFRLHILPIFGGCKAGQITEAEIDRHILQRREEAAKNATSSGRSDSGSRSGWSTSKPTKVYRKFFVVSAIYG